MILILHALLQMMMTVMRVTRMIITNVDRLHPRRSQTARDLPSLGRIGMQHGQNDLLKVGRTLTQRPPLGSLFQKRRILWILQIGLKKRDPAVQEAVKRNGGAPDIHSLAIVLEGHEELRRPVRRRPTDPLTEHALLGHPEIRDFQNPRLGHQQIVGFDVSVHNPLFMQIAQSP